MGDGRGKKERDRLAGRQKDDRETDRQTHRHTEEERRGCL